MKTHWRSKWLSVREDPPSEPYFAADDEVLVIALDGGALLFVEEPAPALGANGLFLPGGGIEPGEGALAAAQRELREETGFGARTLELVARLRPWPKYLAVTSHIVFAADLYAAPLAPDEVHPLILHRRPRADVRAAIASGEIDDARIIAALALCTRWVDG